MTRAFPHNDRSNAASWSAIGRRLGVSVLAVWATAALAGASSTIGADLSERPGDAYVRRALEEYDSFYTEKALSSLRAAARIDPAHPRAQAYLVLFGLFGPLEDEERAQALAALRVIGVAANAAPLDRALVHAALVLGTEGPHAARAALVQEDAGRTPELTYWRAEFAFRAGEYDFAIEDYLALLHLRKPPFVGRVCDHLSALLIFRQRNQEALKVAQRYAAAFPGEADAQGVLATALALAGRPAEGIRIAEEALALHESEDTLAGLGKVLALSGDLAAAREHYRVAIERAADSRRPFRRAALGMLWLVDGDMRRALEAVSPCLRGGADASLAQRGVCLFVAGLADPARIPEIVEDLEVLARTATPVRPAFGNPAQLARFMRARAVYDAGGCVTPPSGPTGSGAVDADVLTALLSGDNDFFAAYHVPFLDTWAQCSLAVITSLRDFGAGRAMLSAAAERMPGRAPILLALASIEVIAGESPANALQRFEHAWPRLSSDSAVARRARSLRAFSLENVEARQAVVVLADDWDATRGRLWMLQRGQDGWTPTRQPFDVMLGKGGLAWGNGLHPAGQAGPKKREGDQRAVAGVFRLSRAYGYASHPPVGVTLTYASAGEGLRCVDDPKSPAYNQIVEERPGESFASAERMHRDDDQYRWTIVVEHNTRAPRPNEGSCIFLHIWRAPGAPTSGCTSMAEPHMTELVQWLRPENRPVLVQLTRDRYEALREGWGLPLLPDAEGLGTTVRTTRRASYSGPAPFPPTSPAGEARARQELLPQTQVRSLLPILRGRRHYAVIAGVCDYKGDRKLRGPCQDARALRELLVGSYGYQPENIVSLISDEASGDPARTPTAGQIRRAIEVIKKRIAENRKHSEGIKPTFVFYYSGHGARRLERREYGLLQPSGFFEHLEDAETVRGLEMRALRESIRDQIEADHMLLLIDACHSGLAAARGVTEDADLRPEVLKAWGAPAFVVMGAGASAERAWEIPRPDATLTNVRASSGKASEERGYVGAFTWAVLEALRLTSDGVHAGADENGDGIVTEDELWHSVHRRVPELVSGNNPDHSQTPVRERFDGPSGGQFLFAPVKAGGPP